jgi:hypothetical protein
MLKKRAHILRQVAHKRVIYKRVMVCVSVYVKYIMYNNIIYNRR